MLNADCTTYSENLAETVRSLKVRVAASMLDRGTITASKSHFEHKGFNNTYQESGYSGIGLYYLCRCLDTEGTGTATFSIKLAAAVLRVKPATIRKWLREGASDGVDFETGLPSKVKRFFATVAYSRGYGNKESYVKVYYRSHHKIALERGIESLGAVAWVQVSELSDTKGLAVLTTLNELQKASLHQAKRSEILNLLKQGKDKKAAAYYARKPIELSIPTGNESSENVTGANIIHVGKRCLFADSGTSLPYGVSQATIGLKLSRSTRSVWNSLNKRYIHKSVDKLAKVKKSQRAALKHKFKHSLPDIYRKQLAMTVEIGSDEYAEVCAIGELNSQGIDYLGSTSLNLNRYFTSQGKDPDSVNFFKSCCNLYTSPSSVDTCSAKAFKSRFTNIYSVALLGSAGTQTCD